MIDETVTFLIIDDDEKNVSVLSRLIDKLAPGYPVFISKDGASGWDEIRRVGSRMIILCGTTVSGVNFNQLLKLIKASDKISNFYFIAVNPPDDKEENIRLFRMGADDLLKRPFYLDDFVSTLKNALRVIKLNNDLLLEKNQRIDLGKTLDEDKESIKNILVKVQEMSIPRAQEKIKTAVESSEWITRRFGNIDDEQVRHITNAASLCLVGRLHLKDDMKGKTLIEGGGIKPESLMKISETARDLASDIRGYEQESDILYHIYENFDGSGFPNKLKAWQIPLGSRLIRIALDYFDYLEKFKDIQIRAVEAMYHEGKRLYDYKIVALFDQYLASTSSYHGRSREVPVSPKELKSGMFVSRNVITNSGIKILSAGVNVSPELISKIQSIHAQDAVLGNIYVKVV